MRATKEMNTDIKGLTENRRKTAEIRDVAAGHTVMIAGIFCTVLDPEFTEEGALVLARDVLFEKAFDEDNSNDWRGSTLRKYLNGAYLEELTDEMEEDPFLEFERDLTADDGQKNYGTCRDKVSLISCDEYRKYREYIPNKSDWWWTLTSRTPRASYSYCVRRVGTDGTLSNTHAYAGVIGVATAFCVSSDFAVEVIE